MAYPQMALSASRSISRGGICFYFFPHKNKRTQFYKQKNFFLGGKLIPPKYKALRAEDSRTPGDLFGCKIDNVVLEKIQNFPRCLALIQHENSSKLERNYFYFRRFAQRLLLGNAFFAFLIKNCLCSIVWVDFICSGCSGGVYVSAKFQGPQQEWPLLSYSFLFLGIFAV